MQHHRQTQDKTLDRSDRINRTIAKEISASADQVASAIKLIDEGSTVPFIARYRKEVTGGLDDTQLRNLAERLSYLREMDERRNTIIKSMRDQEKLTAALMKSVEGATTKSELEDIYLPFKPKRRTKAAIAKEKGLTPLRDAILADRNADPASIAL